MANWRFVLAYDERFAQSLADEGVTHPPVRPGNRMPTLEEIRGAIAQQPTWVEDGRWLPGQLWVREEYDAPNSYRLIIESDSVGWANPAYESFHMRGDLAWELTLVHTLCRLCGQLYVFFDSGDPPIILDSASDVPQILAVWREVNGGEDSWERFCERVYRPG